MFARRDINAAYFACLAVGVVGLSACSGGAGGSTVPPSSPSLQDGSSLMRQTAETGMAVTTVKITSSTKLPVVMLGLATAGPAVAVNLTHGESLSPRGIQPLVGPIVSGGALITDLAHTGNLHNPDVLIHDGTDVWVGEQGSNAIVQINTPQDTSASYPLPTGHNVGGLVFDASHQLWFSDPAKSTFGYIASKTVHEATLTAPHGTGIAGTVLGPNNDIYFGSSGSHEIIQVVPSNPSAPSFLSIGSSYAPKYGVSAAGYLWFTSNGILIRYVFSNGAISGANTYSINAGDIWGPIVAGTDGNLYIADQTQKSVLKVTLSAGTPTTVADLGVNYVPTGLASEGGDSDIWVALPSANQINALNFATAKVDLSIPPPSAGSQPTSVMTMADNSVWWGENTTGFVGTYGQSQQFASMYIYWNPTGNPPYWNTGLYGSFVVTPYGTSGGAAITGSGNDCPNGYTYFTGNPPQTYPVGRLNASVTPQQYSGPLNTPCQIVFESSYGMQSFSLPFPSYKP